jgi:four helix bundle protein
MLDAGYWMLDNKVIQSIEKNIGSFCITFFGEVGLTIKMSYKSLEIYQLADHLVVRIHQMTLTQLPSFEKYETGSQIRRSVKSVKSNIVEGYGRRFYKNDFLHFLIIAQGSLDETTDHLETLFKTMSLTDAELYTDLSGKLDILGRKLTNFIKSVQKKPSITKIKKRPQTTIHHPSSSIHHPASSIHHPLSIIHHPILHHLPSFLRHNRLRVELNPAYGK